MKTGSAGGQGKYHIQSEINMIPLIDVALVLLIIFMVISPMIVESQLKVKLPEVTSASQAEESAIKIEIDERGNTAIDGKVIPKSNLKTALSVLLPPGHKAAVIIQADKNVPFDHVVYVMDLAKQLNVEKLGVSVVPDLVN